MTTPQAPEPLSTIELDLLAAYREATPMPAATKASVGRRLRQGSTSAARPSPIDRTAVRIAIGLAAAAAVLVALWALSPRRTGAGAGDDDDARDQAVYAGERASTAGRADARAPQTPTSRRGSAPVVPEPDDGAASEPAPLELGEVDAIDPTSTSTPGDVPVGEPRAPRPRAKRRATDPNPAPISPAVDPSPPAASPLAQEREILARAWAALARGDADDAIAIAKTHADRFPAAILAVERRAIERIAACKAEHEGWRQKALAFLAAHGRTPLARKVRDACGDDSPGQ